MLVFNSLMGLGLSVILGEQLWISLKGIVRLILTSLLAFLRKILCFVIGTPMSFRSSLPSNVKSSAEKILFSSKTGQNSISPFFSKNFYASLYGKYSCFCFFGLDFPLKICSLIFWLSSYFVLKLLSGIIPCSWLFCLHSEQWQIFSSELKLSSSGIHY